MKKKQSTEKVAAECALVAAQSCLSALKAAKTLREAIYVAVSEGNVSHALKRPLSDSDREVILAIKSDLVGNFEADSSRGIAPL
jgi:hypothetical protein